jgi:hypothetical protein
MPEAPAQNYPARPVRFAVGTGQDMIARLVGETLSSAWPPAGDSHSGLISAFRGSHADADRDGFRFT